MEAQIETGGQVGDDVSGLDREIDWLIGLLATDEDLAVIQSAIFTLVGIGPPAFVPLSEALYETEDVRLRVRTIEVLGISSLSHTEAIAILVAAWRGLVEPRARGGDPEGPVKEEVVDLSEYRGFADAYRHRGRFLDDVYDRTRIHSSLG
jgi:hypothetical protein